MRTCDNCGSRLAPFFPRKRGSDGESLLCNTCKDREDLVVATLTGMGPDGAFAFVSGLFKEGGWGSGWYPRDRDTPPQPGGEALVQEHEDLGHEIEFVSMSSGEKVQCVTDKMVLAWYPEDSDEPFDYIPAGITYTGVRKHAHDSGDGETIYHCPFCGAGGVMGRSDGTAECQFCGTSFTVQVQPKMPSMPQTVDGQPYHNPEMPGEETPPGEAVPGQEEGLPQETDVPGAGGDTPNPNPFSDPNAPAKKPNPFAAILRPEFITRQGNKLSEEDYIKHLALAHADDREAVLDALREG